MVVVDRQLHADQAAQGGDAFDAGFASRGGRSAPAGCPGRAGGRRSGPRTGRRGRGSESEPGPGGAVGELDGFERGGRSRSVRGMRDERAVRPLVKLLPCAPPAGRGPSLRTTIWSATSKASRLVVGDEQAP